ncbi:MAG: hypothetical protein CM1200mP41_29640 [Gammaproteobacteria bacterium]|nr:MAG: hypothetical protein CM1200mP41_29640 [Gammaproteobacteria bacterium]
MSNNRLQGWNPQKTAFTYAKDREFGPGLRGARLCCPLVCRSDRRSISWGDHQNDPEKYTGEGTPECTVTNTIFNSTMCYPVNQICH